MGWFLLALFAPNEVFSNPYLLNQIRAANPTLLSTVILSNSRFDLEDGYPDSDFPFNNRRLVETGPLRTGLTQEDYKAGRRNLGVDAVSPKEGDPLCRCLEKSELPPLAYEDLSFEDQLRFGSEHFSDDYGFGCYPHDNITELCRVDYQKWCDRSWCWVNPGACELQRKRTPKNPVSFRFYSYATCRDMDYFTDNTRIDALQDRTIKMGVNTNSGGWKGAYNKNGKHFVGPITDWYGPAINFVLEAAEYSNARFEIVEPPKFLFQRSDDFWLDNSTFDVCVYATTLGYLDLCVSQYTVTGDRALAVDWFVLDELPLILITEVDIPTVIVDFQSLQDKIAESFSIIFEPFTMDAWLFLGFLVIPLMAVLMVVHEYGVPGGKFPVAETKILRNEDEGTVEAESRTIPVWEHIFSSLYKGFLGVLQGGWPDPVSSLGAKIHLIGMAFMILAILAVYTANLAAILRKSPPVQTFSDSMSQGYRYCADRQVMDIVLNGYKVTPNRFVNDPDDGKPGFQGKRGLVFDRIDIDKAPNDKNYCHAAIAFMQDLEVEWANNRHCNKTKVNALDIGTIETGFPIFADISDSLRALFSLMKNEGAYGRNTINSPESTCVYTGIIYGEVDTALSLEELAGIWVISACFAAAGLIISYFKPWEPIQMRQKRRREKGSKRSRKAKRVSTETLCSKDDFVPPKCISVPPTFEHQKKGTFT